MGITAQAISKWENGHTLPETVLLPILANIFNCSIDSILIPYAEQDSIFRDFMRAACRESGELAIQLYEKIKGKFTFPVIYNDEYQEYHNKPGGRSARFNFVGSNAFIARMDRHDQVSEDNYVLARISLPNCSSYMQIIDNMPKHIKEKFRYNDCTQCHGYECPACMIYTFEGVDYRQCHFITIRLDSAENMEHAFTLICAEAENYQ